MQKIFAKIALSVRNIFISIKINLPLYEFAPGIGSKSFAFKKFCKNIMPKNRTVKNHSITVIFRWSKAAVEPKSSRHRSSVNNIIAGTIIPNKLRRQSLTRIVQGFKSPRFQHIITINLSNIFTLSQINSIPPHFYKPTIFTVLNKLNFNFL